VFPISGPDYLLPPELELERLPEEELPPDEDLLLLPELYELPDDLLLLPELYEDDPEE